MKNVDVISAFVDKKPAGTMNLTSTGRKLFSYHTCIAQWTDDGILIVNTTKYSATTSKHKTQLLNAVGSRIDKGGICLLSDMRRHVSDLEKAYMSK